MSDNLLFSQKDGFTMFDLPEEFEWRQGESDTEWLKRIGYTEAVWSAGNNDGMWTVRALGRSDDKLPEFALSLLDMHQGDIIFVKNKADFIALRIQLAPLLLAEETSYFVAELHRKLVDNR